MLTTAVLTHDANATGRGHSPHANSVAHYYAEADDYYYKEGHATEWEGKGAEALGLVGPVNQEQFRDMLLGKLPNGETIATTFDQDNSKRMGVDLTFSAPKSVSIQALIGGDTRVIAAHDLAVSRALEYAETLAVARRKTKGKSVREATGNMVFAKFRHDLSRLKDPQLHTHAIALNMTQRSDGQWRALNNEALLKQTKLIGAAYRAELASELQQLGYRIRVTDQDGAFELDHISRDQLEAFSQRSKVIEDALANEGKTRATASSLEKRVIALATRNRKEDLDKEVLQQYWQEKSRELGLNLSKPDTSHENASSAEPSHDLPKPQNAKEAVAFAVHHLTERQSVMREHELITTAVQHAVGRTTPKAVRAEITRQIETGYLIEEQPRYRKADSVSSDTGRTDQEWVKELETKNNMPRKLAKAYVAEALAEGRLVKSAPRYTTQTALTREKSILKLEREGRSTVAPIMPASLVQQQLATSDLNQGQRNAVTVLLGSDNRFSGVQGLAGTGKTHMLKTAKTLAEENGFRVIAVAAYGSQVKAVEEAGVKGYTLASFLAMKENPVDSRTIVVLDEAGVVPTRQMEQAMRLIDRRGARMVMLGDIQQTKAIEAGRPFAQLQAKGMQTAVMDEIQRQRDPTLKKAVELAAKGEVAASLSNIREIQSIKDMDDRHARIVADYMALDEKERHSTLVVSGTNEARKSLNSQMRVALQLEGKGQQVDTLHRVDLTQAQRRHAPSYKINDVISPERDYQSVQLERNKLYRVTDVLAQNQLRLQANDGSERLIDPRKLTHLSVYRREKTEMAAGDWVRVTRNNPSLDVANGDRMRVASVEKERIVLQSGVDEKSRQVEFSTAAPLHMEHAYATTVHSAQGLTSNRVMIDADTHSLTSARDVYYVAISRARHEARIYTDDSSKLPVAFNRENHKLAALDLANRKQRTLATPDRLSRFKVNSERPKYERIDPELSRRWQRAAAIYQSRSSKSRPEATARSVAGMRNLSGIHVVPQQLDNVEMLLPKNARHRVAERQLDRPGVADHGMRRPDFSVDGTGATGNGKGAAGKALKTGAAAKPAISTTPPKPSVSGESATKVNFGPKKGKPGAEYER
jgi:conjugative relaxase-like TrwC/TraI family protein